METQDRAYDWIAHYAARRPTHPAVVDLATGETLDYRGLDERASRVAAVLRGELEVEAGDRVALYAHNCADYLAIQFACWRVGAILLPLNTRLALPELTFIAGDAEPCAMIYDRELATEAGALAERVGLAATVELDPADPGCAYRRLVDATPPLPAAEHHRAALGDVGTIMYTSGTTGRPKGALITHRMTLSNAINLGTPARVTRDTVHLCALPLFHTGGLNCYSNVALHCGATVLVMRGFDPAAALALMTDEARGVTHFFGVPAHYQTLAQQPGFEGATFGLVNAGVGGAPVPAALLERWQAKGVPMQQGYGMTETSPTALVLDTERAEDKLGSAGLPALHTEVKLVDGEGNDLDAPGVVGEIWVRGPNVSPGYWRRPDADAASFVDGWLKTGDAARRDEDGFYFIVDRWKDMFISGGENVYPAEVEGCLYALDGVAECAVVGVPDERWGEVGRAYVVAAAGVTLDEDAIVTHCRDHLAKYKVPRTVRFLEALPRNAAGKVLKRELRERRD